MVPGFQQHTQQPCVNPALICDWCKDGGCTGGIGSTGVRARRAQDGRHGRSNRNGGGFGPFPGMMPFPGPFFWGQN